MHQHVMGFFPVVHEPVAVQVDEDLHLQGRLPLDRFVSETIGLDDVEEAFHRMERGEVLRSVVVIGDQAVR